MGSKFDELVSQIAKIGLEHHATTILENSRNNAPFIRRTVREITPDVSPALVISAGPSLYRGDVLARIQVNEIGYADFTIIATDGAYIKCLKAGIKPDWVVTIDPHPTRIAVLFGAESQDDYFERARPDHGFELAQENRALVDANRVPIVMASSAPETVVECTKTFDRYWFVPLVDDPEHEGLTRQMVEATGAPALNTGGTVGTAAWAFAHCVLKSKDVAVVGMDFGYPADTPLKNTQEWNLTGGDRDLYPWVNHDYYTSPTYWWYRGNFLELLEAADTTITNCSEGGLLDGQRVKRIKLEEWLKSSS